MTPASPAAPDTPTVLVVDPSRIVREWLGFRLGLAGFRAVEAAGGAAALAVGRDAALAAAVLEVDLPDADGVDVCAALRQRRPGLVLCVLTTRRDDDVVARAVAAGARGYLLKDASPREIERAVRAVANGEVLLGPDIAAKALAYLHGARRGANVPFPELTDREREVLDLVARGHDNMVIARRLSLSPKTVRNHLSNVLTKLQVADRAQAIVRAREAGLGTDP
jgi:DNA-binding NarL/FixJ family response regulator